MRSTTKLLNPPTCFPNALLFYTLVLSLFSPKTHLNYTLFIRLCPKLLTKHQRLLPSTIFIYLFFLIYIPFIFVVIICYIYAFVFFSYLKLGDLSTTLEMTVLSKNLFHKVKQPRKIFDTFSLSSFRPSETRGEIPSGEAVLHHYPRFIRFTLQRLCFLTILILPFSSGFLSYILNAPYFLPKLFSLRLVYPLYSPTTSLSHYTPFILIPFNELPHFHYSLTLLTIRPLSTPHFSLPFIFSLSFLFIVVIICYIGE